EDAFVVPGNESLLTALQSDLSLGKPRATRRAGTFSRHEPDTSISVHSCHSPMREVEVLRDQLLAAFEADPGLEPHDVIVMTPDIDAYAPLIEAVFGRDANEPGFIPFRISD